MEGVVLERSGFAITALVFILFNITERNLLNKIKCPKLHLHLMYPTWKLDCCWVIILYDLKCTFLCVPWDSSGMWFTCLDKMLIFALIMINYFFFKRLLLPCFSIHNTFSHHCPILWHISVVHKKRLFWFLCDIVIWTV